MDLRQLRHVCTLARTGSFVRAAAELHLTQPALSRSVQRLEADLGLRIFDRDRSGVKVTAAGRTLVERAQDVLLDAQALRSDAGAAARGELASVGAGFAPLPARMFVAALLLHAARELPRVQLRVDTAPAPGLIDALMAERIEFCVLPAALMPNLRRLRIEALGRFALAPVVRAGHPLARRASTPIGDLRRFPIVAGTMSQEVLASTQLLLGAAADDPTPFRMLCDDYDALERVVLESDAVWLTCPGSVAGRVRSGELRAVRLARPLQPVEFVVAALSRRTLSPAALRLVEALRSQATALASSERGSSNARRRKARGATSA